MLNVHELERRWLRYKIKRYLPIGMALLSVFILLIGTIFFRPLFSTLFTADIVTESRPAASATVKPTVLQPGTSIRRPEPTAQSPLPNTQTAASVTAQQERQAASEPVKNILNPSLGFIDRLVASEATSKQREPLHQEAAAAPQKAPALEAVTPKPRAEPATAEKPQIMVKADPQPPRLSITQEEANDLNDVVKRFETNKNPALSLFLARRYYDLGQYDRSYEYALKTNEIDSTVEESWLIFARSLVKLGRKEEALKTLVTYVKHSSSARAKTLFDEIQEGTFK